MKDFRLIELLKTFSPEEFKDFEKFISSPYFSKGRDVMPLFKLLKKYYPDFNSDRLTKEGIYEELYQGKKYDEVKAGSLLRTIISDLYKLCKDYLIILELKSDDMRKKYYLLNQLRKRKNYRGFEKEFQNIDYDSDIVGKGSVNHFLEKYFLTIVYRDYTLEKDEFERSFEANLHSGEMLALAALINVFKFEDEKKLAIAYNLKVRENFLDFIANNLDSEKITDLMKDSGNSLYPYLHVNFMMYMMNKDFENDRHFPVMKNILNENRNLFGSSEIYILWNMMLSYCNHKQMTGNNNFSKYIHEIEKKMVNEGIHRKSPDEDFHIILFRNILISATRQEEYEWAEEFIEKYSSQLNIEHRENMRYYSMAYLSLAKKEFDKALEHIVKIKYDLFIFKIDMKLVMMKIYFELGYEEQLYSMMETTRQYLKNTKDIYESLKKFYYNFIKYLKELMNIKFGKNVRRDDIEILKKMIADEKFVSNHEWLMKKVSEVSTKRET